MMTLTPVEIRHVKPKRTPLRGYDREAVDRLLDEIVASFENVWRERADMADKVEQYLEAFRAASLEADHDLEGPMGRGLYIATG